MTIRNTQKCVHPRATSIKCQIIQNDELVLAAYF